MDSGTVACGELLPWSPLAADPPGDFPWRGPGLGANDNLQRPIMRLALLYERQQEWTARHRCELPHEGAAHFSSSPWGLRRTCMWWQRPVQLVKATQSNLQPSYRFAPSYPARGPSAN